MRAPLGRRAGRLLAREVVQPRVELEELAGGVVRITLSTRLLRRHRLFATCYLLSDLLVDTGFSHLRAPLVKALEPKSISAIACTHHHEDHTGNAGALAARHGCPVYLRNLGARLSEGLDRMPSYRRLYWGEPGPYSPVEMPEVVETGRRRLRAVPSPGHSATHTVFLEEATGLVLTGDLYVSGGASAVMTHENPFESVRSLRKVADLEPELMLTGHGLALERPADRLRLKADRVELAARRVLELHRRGVSDRGILRRLFRFGRGQDRLMAAVTGGEFSRGNFVRACIAHENDAELLD